MKKMLLALAVMTIAGAGHNADAAAADAGKFSGYMFGDYYYVAGNHDPALEDLNGFWFRRIYFTYDRKIDDNVAVRLRTEMAHPGDFATKGKMTPVVKDAYVKWTHDRQQVVFGISPRPTWEVIEKVWGYRSIEKTLLDLQKGYGSSRDFGLAVKGKLGAEGKAYYHTMVANGNSNASETNTGKMVMGSLGAWVTDQVLIEAYADYDRRPDDTSRYTLQGFAAYKTDKARLGLQVAYQNRQMGPGTDDANWTLWSVFGAARLTETTWAFARADGNSDPNPDGPKTSYLPFAADAKPLFLVAGLDFTVAKNLHLMPNVEAVTYSATGGGADPDADLVPRVTLFYKF